MDVTPLIRRNAKIIQSYKDGAFVISGEAFNHAVAVDIDHVTQWIPASHHARELTLDDFASVLVDGHPYDVVLLGTGKSFVMLPLSFRQAFRERFNVVLDVMDTGAAARTFNVLMAEGRDVAALMLPA